MFFIQFILVTGLILIHLFPGTLLDLMKKHREWWISASGGIAVAYVFLHLFPELTEAQESLAEGSRILPWIEHHAYLLSLLGLTVFYGLESIVKNSKQDQEGKPPASESDTKHQDGGSPEQGPTSASCGVFYLHIGSFALYNALVGYLLVHRQDQDGRSLLLFFIAIALHFLVNDAALRRHHKDTYRRIGRWILAAAILIGWTIGRFTEISAAATGALFAFLAGGIVLNVLKEELPEERRSSFIPFAAGVTVYSVLLLFL